VTAPWSNERSGISNLAFFLKPSFWRKIAAAGLASAAAALLYKKSDQPTEPDGQGAADQTMDPQVAPALQATKQVARPGSGQRTADSSTQHASAEEVASAGPVRTRKKRSDAGSKRPRKPVTSSTTATVPGQLIPELQSTDTGVMGLSAEADSPAQLQDSQSDVEAEAHPS
jgi:hypothetical protein